MQKNASLLAIVAIHTAENEPSEVGDDVPLGVAARSGEESPVFWTGAESGTSRCQISDGSFSAVPTATIASKDAFFCIFRNLQDLHPFAPF